MRIYTGYKQHQETSLHIFSERRYVQQLREYIADTLQGSRQQCVDYRTSGSSLLLITES
jgi:hypothetical protein